MTPLIGCPKCRAWLLDDVFNRQELKPCPACGTPVQVEVFPALFRKTAAGQEAQPVMVEGESSCFYHPQKKAVVPCTQCGRFLCALCDCELHGDHLCPACLESGKNKGQIKALDNQRMRYDNIALAVAVIPLITFYFTIITAPIALYIAIRYWNAPLSVAQRSRFRFILAIILALLQITGWVVVFILLAGKHH